MFVRYVIPLEGCRIRLNDSEIHFSIAYCPANYKRKYALLIQSRSFVNNELMLHVELFVDVDSRKEYLFKHMRDLLYNVPPREKFKNYPFLYENEDYYQNDQRNFFRYRDCPDSDLL